MARICCNSCGNTEQFSMIRPIYVKGELEEEDGSFVLGRVDFSMEPEDAYISCGVCDATSQDDVEVESQLFASLETDLYNDFCETMR